MVRGQHPRWPINWDIEEGKRWASFMPAGRRSVRADWATAVPAALIASSTTFRAI